MNLLDQLKSVLCDPEGKCCIAGSDDDRAIVDRALQALAQPEQEPGAWMSQAGNFLSPLEFTVADAALYGWTPLYTTPPQRQWVGLTEAEHEDIVEWLGHDVSSQVFYAIEKLLKERNT
jgi:hypothetical protein